MLNLLKMLNHDKRYISLEQTPLSRSEREWGAFRVLDSEGNIFDEFGLNEMEATDLAIWLNGSIEHYSVDHHIWTKW